MQPGHVQAICTKTRRTLFTRREIDRCVSVVEHLEKLLEIHGKPAMIRSHNGREFIA